jgi:hypothetical protein
VVDVVPDEARRWDPVNWQLCDPARPTTIVSGGPGRRRWDFMRLPDEPIEALAEEATAWRLLAPWGMRPDTARLERHVVYTFRACWADAWRRGRLLLAGDAAHLMPPFAGQGLCSGLRDAANLAWKLDLVLAGRASDALLDSYPSERIPHARAVIGLSMALGQVICIADPAEARARDERMLAEARAQQAPIAAQMPPLGPGCFAAGSPAAGALFVQGRVRRGGREGRFDDVLGSGFALVSPHGDPAAQLAPEQAGFFASLGGVTTHVGAGGAPVVDLGGDYARCCARSSRATPDRRAGARLPAPGPTPTVARPPEELPTMPRPRLLLASALAAVLAAPLALAAELPPERPTTPYRAVVRNSYSMFEGGSGRSGGDTIEIRVAGPRLYEKSRIMEEKAVIVDTEQRSVLEFDPKDEERIAARFGLNDAPIPYVGGRSAIAAIDPAWGEPRVTGEDKVAKRGCTVLEYGTAEDGAVACVSKEGVVLRLRLAWPGYEREFEILDFSPGRQDEKWFQPPKGFQVVEGASD